MNDPFTPGLLHMNQSISFIIRMNRLNYNLQTGKCPNHKEKKFHSVSEFISNVELNQSNYI